MWKSDGVSNYIILLIGIQCIKLGVLKLLGLVPTLKWFLNSVLTLPGGEEQRGG